MIAQFFSIGLISLLGAMLPGPDFAIVTKNTISYGGRSGYLTTIGIGAAIVVHMCYCLFGLALIISHLPLLFSLIKYMGASYLFYLGLTFLFFKTSKEIFPSQISEKKIISYFSSFSKGFLCNLLNPKATLFFLSLFTVVIKQGTPLSWQLLYASEIVLIAVLWFCILSTVLSHRKIRNLLEKAEQYIAKFLGVFLIGFGIILVFLKQ